MIFLRYKKILTLLTFVSPVILSGCASDGYVGVGASYYYGYGHYHHDYYRGDVIVRPPARPPEGSRPKPEHPIHRPRPPSQRPSTLPARPMPAARPGLRR